MDFGIGDPAVPPVLNAMAKVPQDALSAQL
jgi:hypothetical protein